MSITNVPSFVRDELKRDESIVWLGQPDSRFAFLLSLPLLVIALIVAFLTPHNVSLEFKNVFDFVGFSFGLLNFIPVALFGIMPLYLARRASRTFYVLSNKRVLIMQDGRTRTVQSYDRASLTPMFKMNFGGKSMLCWRVPGMSYDDEGRLTPNTAVFLRR